MIKGFSICMKIPPKYIDDGKVLKWAWYGKRPFGFDGDTQIFGLAICQYNDSATVYRFSCDKEWETIQDASYDNVEQAVGNLPEQYKNITAEWRS